MIAPALSRLGAICLPAYFGVSLVIGWFTRPGRNATANSFLNASRSLSMPLVIAAFLAANCGALEVIGLSAMAAQYGALAFHFYWVGAIPAMICLGLYVLPVYRRSGVHSMPQFLSARFGPRLAAINAAAVALAMLMLSGISMYAMAQVLEVVLHLRFAWGVLLSACVVLSYVLMGGLRATLYTEVFQLLVMVAGLLPLALRSVALLRHSGPLPPAQAHAWAILPVVQSHAPMDRIGVIFGLGLVLSFGYWCTDFVLMQRALAARTELQARAVPLCAGFGKLIFGFLVVVPGLAATHLHAAERATRYDQSLPTMMTVLYGPTMLGVGLTALAASLMSGLAANVSGFSAVWTEDLYRRHWRPGLPEAHYLRAGRVATVAAVLVGLLCSTVSFHFGNLMEHVQLIFALLNAPFWAVFLLGVSTRRITEKGASLGFLAGVAVGGAHALAVLHGWLHYGSRMSGDFHAALLAFLSALAVSWFGSLHTRREPGSRETPKLFPARGRAFQADGGLWLWGLAAALLGACIFVDRLWW